MKTNRYPFSIVPGYFEITLARNPLFGMGQTP
jgi:hypothetical protein